MTRTEFFDRFWQAIGIIAIAAVMLGIGGLFVWDTLNRPEPAAAEQQSSIGDNP